MMSNKALLSLAMVALFATTAKADTSTTVETTTNWFAVVASSVDLTTANWGPVKPTREAEATVIDVDTSAAAPAMYTPSETKPYANRYRVTGSMTVTLNAAVPGNDVFDETLPKAALVAVDDNGTGKWYAWHLTGQGAGAWVAMTGHTPTEGTTYAVTIEFTGTTVSYTVDGTQLQTAGVSPSATLTNAGGLSIASIGLAGYGSFGDFRAVGYEEFEVTVSDSYLTKYGIALSEEPSAADIKAAFEAIGANGYPKWQSIVLGLKDSASQPYLVPVQNATTGTLSIELGGIAPATGYDVSYAVEEVATPNTAMSASPTYNSPASVTLSSESVKYYKIKIKITK